LFATSDFLASSSDIAATKAKTNREKHVGKVQLPYSPIAGLPPGKRITACVDYDNAKVEWNRYEFADGITLCLTALPLTIFSTDMTDPKGMPVYILVWSNVLRVTAPESLAGAPTPALAPEQLKRVPSTVMKPLTVTEPWSEFELKDGHTLRSRLIATEIRRVTNAFDQTGMPLFIVNSQTVLDISETQSAPRE
jgi:hypothetical protein